MADFLDVSTATATREQAVALARSVVESHLAAGAQIIGPVISAFWHDSEFGTGEEWKILMKTRADLYAQLEAHLLERHPWKTPEISATAIVARSDEFQRWVTDYTQPSPAE
ncbi:divalent-cation tolerance protein CutA [Streptomyces sp. NPDC052236]|uniref:divalent-cation tolerance protein CutA n=1 Tax=Streptomyces sp. NPDC052236 TaxID=3365686 RepID=UPI0037CF6649